MKDVVLAIDYGDRFAGLALLRKGSIPFGFSTIENAELSNKKWWSKIAEELEQIIKKEKVELLLIGLPRSMSGVNSPQTDLVQEFIKYVKLKVSIEIQIVDERLTTQEAKRKNSPNLHEEAARLLLESYLDQ